MRSVLLITALSLVPVGVASAHIHLTNPLARTDGVTTDQKEQHCGVANQQRTTRVTTYQPGATVTITWLESINHTGWFRIAFQPNGDIFGIPPASNGPTGLGAASNYPTEDRTGMVDAVNGSIVLKDRIMDGLLTTDVTLPTMECANCTMQFIQVMTDKPPYTEDALSDDIYFNCADITISATAPDAGATGGGPDAGTGSGSNTGGLNTEVTGGCSTSGGAGLPIGLALLGLVSLRRRRR